MLCVSVLASAAPGGHEPARPGLPLASWRAPPLRPPARGQGPGATGQGGGQGPGQALTWFRQGPLQNVLTFLVFGASGRRDFEAFILRELISLKGLGSPTESLTDGLPLKSDSERMALASFWTTSGGHFEHFTDGVD